MTAWQRTTLEVQQKRGWRRLDWYHPQIEIYCHEDTERTCLRGRGGGIEGGLLHSPTVASGDEEVKPQLDPGVCKTAEVFGLGVSLGRKRIKR